MSEKVCIKSLIMNLLHYSDVVRCFKIIIMNLLHYSDVVRCFKVGEGGANCNYMLAYYIKNNPK